MALTPAGSAAQAEAPSLVDVSAVCSVMLIVGLAVGLARDHRLLALLACLLGAAGAGMRPSTRGLVPGVLAPLLLVAKLPWPVPVVVALLLAQRLHGWSLPLPKHRPRAAACLAGVLVGVAAALCAAALTVEQLRGTFFVVSVPRPAALLVAAGVLALAATNGLLEELFWRGWMTDTAMRSVPFPPIVVCAQAASFGLAHLGGLPSGVIGMMSAGVLGLVLGLLRSAIRGGLTAAVVAHVLVDVCIFGLAATHVVWV